MTHPYRPETRIVPERIPIPSDTPPTQEVRTMFIGEIGKRVGVVHATKFKPSLMIAPVTYCNKKINPLDENINARFRSGSVDDVTCKSCLKVLEV